MNPYAARLPRRPRCTLRQIVPWIGRSGSCTGAELAARFRLTPGDAAVRLLKLWRWGYCRRQKATEPPRVYRYTLSRFGEGAADRWRTPR